MSIQVEFDWVEAAPSTDKLAQSTMAALTINVHGRPVTSVLDHRTRSCRNHVVTPLAATDRQAQSCAFAAEFLAPAALLKERLRHTHIHPDEVDELAGEFGVSSYVVRHQIRNHNLAAIGEW